MKKFGKQILALALLFCMLAGAVPAAAISEPENYSQLPAGTINNNNGQNLPTNNNGTYVVAQHTHDYGDWKVIKEPTCTETGTKQKTCNSKDRVPCDKPTVTETIPAKGHSWGEWKVTKEATCKEGGTKTRSCSVCGATESQSTPKTDHRWGAWKTVKEATCSETGKRQHRCAVCGELETKIIKKTLHTAGEWEITKEPTCKTRGHRESACIYCGKKMTEEIPKVDHAYDEWETVTEATDFSKGKRRAACRYCGKKKAEEFYPEGTLAKDLDNDPEAVKELQGTLAAMGQFKGKASGKFDKETIAAVKKIQRQLKHKQDGIAWPGLLKLLGLMGKMGKPITEALDKYKLQLVAEQTSAEKSYYEVGDEIIYKWTLTNASKKTIAKNLKIYFFSGLTPDKKKDAVIDEPADLAAGESVSGTYTYTVTKKDALAGKFSYGFIGRGKLGGNVESNKVCFVNAASAGEGGKGGWTPPADEELTITKTVKNKPKNNLFFTKGETIQFYITVSNKTSKDVKNIIVTDALMDSWKDTISVLGSGKDKTYLLEKKVVNGDIGPGVMNTAVISYTGADGKMKLSKATASAPTGQDTDALYIYKMDIGSPKNGLFYMAGEEVTYEVTLTNPTTRTFTDLKIYDLLYSSTKTYKTQAKLEPSKSIVFTYMAKVTEYQAKVLNKQTNIVKVSYKDPDKSKPQSLSNACSVPCGTEGMDGVIIEKTVISTPENGTYYQDGEEIRYLIKITNNTVRDIIDMDVRDSLAEMDSDGYRTIHKNEKLAAGESFETHFTFIVGPYDVENTKVTNLASANWAINKDEYTETYSEPVTVPTAEVTAERKGKPVKKEGDACASTLSAVGDGVTQRDLTECEEHKETAEKSEELLAGGGADEAIDLWDKDIETLYQEWKDATEGEGKRIAENEEAAFNRQMKALDASLALVCDEETAKTIALEERMDKCVGLCYELHAAPETRPDTLEGTHSALTKSNSTDECSHQVTYGKEGQARFVDDQCESHTLTMQLTQYLLDIAANDDDRETAWLRAQANWLLELDTMYDTWYLSADKSQRDIIAADRMSFDTLIEARRAALAEMYPDDPATAAEVLANMIMNRTMTICRTLHEAGILKD